MDEDASLPGQGLTPAEYRALASFRHALRRFLVFSASAAQEAGLAPQQHQALLAIKAHAPDGLMTVGALAEQLVVAPHSAAELVKRMIEGGLVRKVDDPSDRRRTALALTSKAEAILHGLSVAHLTELRGAAPALIAALDAFNDDVLGPEAKEQPGAAHPG